MNRQYLRYASLVLVTLGLIGIISDAGAVWARYLFCQRIEGTLSLAEKILFSFLLIVSNEENCLSHRGDRRHYNFHFL